MALGYLLYWFILIFELILSFSLAVYLLSLLFSSAMGSPYVPTKNKETELFLKEADLKKGQIFYDLGCGDGRILRAAVEEYQVRGSGFDINPFLILLAKFLTKRKKIEGIKFVTKNIFDVDLRRVNVLYIFLMPKLIENLFPKLKKELKKNTLVISHGFAIEGFKKELIKKIDHQPFPTYFYRV